ncbi:MAG: 3-deoxy-7-phosphoheptulonate synthase [Bdellovibrionaceae bacterium]|nr:3-deoxy-7-phosphoheptulonate synthase [Pseudobdellovibrionaceae bacterium]
MIIIMKPAHTDDQLREAIEKVEALGAAPHIIHGDTHITISVIGETKHIGPEDFAGLLGIERVVRISKPYKLAARAAKPEGTKIRIGNLTIGTGGFLVMAGPCSVESEEQTLRIARAVKERGAHVLRGGAFKPRSSPYAFQGLGDEGLQILAKAREETGLPVISEALDMQGLELVAKYADIIQIGARNMQNFPLLKALGKLNKPILLKRGMSATIEEWLMSAEYILSGGNDKVMLCERGIRSFDTQYSRNSLDLNAVPILKTLTHLPVIVDPSHGTGFRHLVSPMALAGMAAGADGIIVEVHDRPDEALSDGPQALLPSDFETLMKKVTNMAPILGVEMQASSKPKKNVA